MEYYEFMLKVDKLRRLYPNLEITPEVIYDYIISKNSIIRDDSWDEYDL